MIKTRDSQGSEKGEEKGEIRKAKAIDKDEGLSRQQDRRGKKGRFVKQRRLIKTRDSQGSEKGEEKKRDS